MEGPRKRPPKRKIVIFKDGDSGSSIQITGGVAKIRMTTALIVIVLLLVLVAAAVVLLPSKGAGPAGIAARTTPGAGPTDTGTVRPADNMPPLVGSAVIVPDRPAADSALDVKYTATDPESNVLTMEFRWYVDSVLVQAGPQSFLQPGPFHKGSTVYAEVIAADQYSFGTPFATAPLVIANSPPSVSSVTLGPDTASIGTMMTVNASGSDPDGDEITFTYQWRVNGSPMGRPVRENTFDTSSLHKKDIVSVMVHFADGEASGGPVISNGIVLQNRKPEITSTAPLELKGGLYVYQVTAKDPDGDPLVYRLDRFPAGMTIDPASGLIRWELTKNVMFTGRNEAGTSVTVSDGDGGSDSQDFTIVVTDVFTN